MNKHSLYLFFCFLLFGSSCKKDKPGTADDEQGDYFTCYVNGQYWEAHSDAAGPQSQPAVYAQMNQYGLSLSATKFYDEGFQKFFIPVYNIQQPGTYVIGKVDSEITGFVNYSEDCNHHYHDTLNLGTFILNKHNPSEHYMSGTFSMRLINKNCEDSVVDITNGKFAFHYY